MLQWNIYGHSAIGLLTSYSISFNFLFHYTLLQYKEASTVLSVGGIRQQFSMPENILLSLYGMQFLRDMPRLLEVDGEPPPSVNFQPHGYLTLASECGIEQLKQNLYVQQ